jgi:hypothetical protein
MVIVVNIYIYIKKTYIYGTVLPKQVVIKFNWRPVFFLQKI